MNTGFSRAEFQPRRSPTLRASRIEKASKVGPAIGRSRAALQMETRERPDAQLQWSMRQGQSGGLSKAGTFYLPPVQGARVSAIPPPLLASLANLYQLHPDLSIIK